MSKTINTRELVLQILEDVEKNGSYSHKSIGKVLTTYQYLDKHDRAFIGRLAEGTIEYQLQLDYIINQFSTVKTNKMKLAIRNILRMSLYQIMYMNNVPASAACNEAVKLAQKKGFHNLKGFINGVLRNIERNQRTIQYPDIIKEPVQYLSVKFSMPEWIVEHFLKSYDMDIVSNIFSAFMNETDTTVRANLLKITPMELQKELEKQKIEVEQSKYLDYAFKISGYNYLANIDAFCNGKMIVQDISSMFVTEVANPNKHDIIIDVCAAPGGKTLHMAERLHGAGVVKAYDLTEQKAAFIKENVNRVGLHNIEVNVSDATQLDIQNIGIADIVIADVPCSGLGVLGKKNDIKYKRKKEDLNNLVLLQKEILRNVVQYVKEKGILIYSTCTINEDENLENVKWLMKEYEFELETITNYLPKELQSETTDIGYIQILPNNINSDGFFIARLRKNG